jgi:hypothetical protein
MSAKFGVMLRRVEWAADRNRVRLEGIGFWVEMWVDAQAVNVTGDAPLLGRLLGNPLALRLDFMGSAARMRRMSRRPIPTLD